MENVVKAVLYAYPVLKTAEKDYAEHIENMAVLSYRSDEGAERVACRIADEIVCKRKLAWLKERVENILDKLTESERTLIAIRYFGKKRKIKSPVKEDGKWNESRYFRAQNRLVKRLAETFVYAGLTKERFERDFANMDIFERLMKFLVSGKERRLSANERAWMGK